MTRRSAEKRMARTFAHTHGMSYRAALSAVRASRRGDVLPYVQRLLIEAVEGCGVRHWARIDEWDGVGSVVITDIGGEVYRLTTESLAPVVSTHIDEGTISEPLDVDSYLADDIIQSALFGCVIYRHEVRHRPVMVA